MKTQTGKGIALAILAASLYAINAPFSKLLLDYLPATLMAGFLYIGAGIGIARKAGGRRAESKLTRAELSYTVGMIALDIAAPICLLIGLRSSTAANAALLNNFEIVATALIALFAFGEKISPRLWAGIIFVTFSCAVLSFEDSSGFRFSVGSLFVLLAAACWGA